MLRFAKYHGLGNDFVIVNRLTGGDPLDAATVRSLCDRHRGIGADGVLTLWPDGDADGRMQVQNADGSDSAMCGNGLRCLARYMHDEGIVPTKRREVTLRAGTQIYSCERLDDDLYRVVMGKAAFGHPDLPPDGQSRFEVGGRGFNGSCAWMGNPHLVVFTDGDPDAMTRAYGGDLEGHRLFRSRTNVTFARATDDGFRAVVHERGVGITQACGSGAAAVAATAVQRGLWPTGKPMLVRLPGGTLTLHVDAAGVVTMEGAAVRVFVGEVGSR